MALKDTDQPTVLRGKIQQTSWNTLAVKEISVPRDISSRLLFDIDQIRLGGSIPVKSPGVNSMATLEVQIVISDDQPTALFSYDDPKMLAEYRLQSVYNATDRIQVFEDTSRPSKWDSPNYANYVPDDKVWLLVNSASATAVLTGECQILGKLAKVSPADFEALVLSRL